MKKIYFLPVLFLLSLFISCNDDDNSNFLSDEVTSSTPSGLYDDKGVLLVEYLYDGNGNIARLNYLDSDGSTIRSAVWDIISDTEYTREAYINGGTKYYITDKYERLPNNDVIKTRYNKNTGVETFVQRFDFGECFIDAIYDVDENGNEKVIFNREYSNNCLTEVTTYPNGITITNEYDGRLYYDQAIYGFDFYDGLYVEKGNVISTIYRNAAGDITNSSTTEYEYNDDGLVTKIIKTNRSGTVVVRNIRH